MNFVERVLAVIVVSYLVERGRCSSDLKDSVSKGNNKRNREAALGQTGKRPAILDAKRESLASFIYGRCAMHPDPPNNRLQDLVGGTINLRQPLHGGPTEIRLNLTGFNRLDRRRRHGIRVHEFGDLTDGCRSAGGYYNPFGISHNSANTQQFKHFGDLGSIEESGDGTVGYVVKDYALSLLGPFSILGRAAVIHQDGDDVGVRETKTGGTTTSSGDRLACCTIGLSDGAGWL